MKNLHDWLILVFLLMALPVRVGAESADSIGYEAQALVTFSGGAHTPFWFVNNQQGLGSLQKNNGYMKVGAFGDMHRGHKFTWGWGAEFVGGYNQEAPFIIQQLYAEARYRAVSITFGSKVRHAPFNDSKLSSGDLLFSENARPVPQARIDIPDYLDIPGTRHWVSVKGYGSLGIFTDDKWQKHFVQPGGHRTERVLFHSKGGWLRIGNLKEFPLEFEGGLEMAAQWGGRIYQGDKLVLTQPHSLKDLFHIIIPQGGGDDTPIGEQTNVYGNHVGEWSASLRWQGQGWGVRAYYEHYFEDHSQMFFDYEWRDGLWGIEAVLPTNPFLGKVVYEFLYTKDQAGSVYWDHTPDLPEQVSGKDNYYNHGIYTGWQHWGMGIGNPLIISPVYTDPHSLSFKSNRIIGHHVGIEGRPFQRLGYRALASYTRSWGTYGTPFRDVQRAVAGMLEATYYFAFWDGFSVSAACAVDAGALLGRSAGVMVSLKKTGSIFCGK